MSEGLRLRCVCRDCPLRPQAEREKLFAEDKPHDARAEIALSDREDDDVNDDQPEEEEAKQDAENEALAEALGPDPNDGAPLDFTVDLWHHAGGKEYYKSLATLGMEDKTPQHIVTLTSTAHPGVALAAHDLKARAYLLFTKTVLRHGKPPRFSACDY